MIEGMSQETFDANKQPILAAIDALMDNPKSRKRFRLLALYERSTGELLAEVFGTHHGPVVVYRSTGAVTRGRNHAPFARQGRGLAELIVAPLTGDPEQEFKIMPSHTQGRLVIDCQDFSQWIAAGKTRHAVS